MKRVVTLVSPGGKKSPILVDKNYVPANGYSIECEECLKEVKKETPIKKAIKEVAKKVKKTAKKK